MYSFIAEDNGLTGTIPSEIGNFKKLREFNLSKFVERSSHLFYCVHSLTWFIVLRITRGNRLRGTIPSEVATLTKLRVVNLGKHEYRFE